MSLEELTKTQLILLVLLICFVSSIATSVITTGLLAEAPLQTTQTINRIVQNTVEKVVPGDVVTQTETIYIEKNEGDIIAQIYEEAYSTMYQISDSQDKKINAFSVGDNDLVYSDNGLGEDRIVLEEEVPVSLGEEKNYSGMIVSRPKDDSLLLNSISVESSPKTGETVLFIDPQSGELFDSRISSVVKDESDIVSGLSFTDALPAFSKGTIVLDLEGKAIGFLSTKEDGSRYVVLASSVLSV